MCRSVSLFFLLLAEPVGATSEPINGNTAVMERDMGGPEHRNTAKKINEHRITARKVDETPSPQQLFLTI